MIDTGGIGGAETVYLNLICGLDHKRWRHVAVVPTHGWLFDRLKDAGIQPIVISERNSVDVVFFARLFALIRRLRVDIIHGHLFGSAVRAALLSRVSRVPAIGTLHGTIDLPPGERFRRLKVSAINHGLKRIVFVSELLRRSFLTVVPLRHDLATVIENGINPKPVSRRDGDGFRGELGILPDEFVVGTVGNPGPAKGFDVLLDAASILKAQSPGYRFVIVGELAGGRGNELMQDRAARGLTGDVVLTGFRSDVNRALAAFDVYALTSRTEGFPLSLLEAMAAGLPVVATRCGGPQQIMDDGVTGILVENGSAGAIASSIAGLRSDAEKRRRLGNSASKAVSERFTLDAQLKSYERLYNECLSGVGNRRLGRRSGLLRSMFS